MSDLLCLCCFYLGDGLHGHIILSDSVMLPEVVCEHIVRSDGIDEVVGIVFTLKLFYKLILGNYNWNGLYLLKFYSVCQVNGRDLIGCRDWVASIGADVVAGVERLIETDHGNEGIFLVFLIEVIVDQQSISGGW